MKTKKTGLLIFISALIITAVVAVTGIVVSDKPDSTSKPAVRVTVGHALSDESGKKFGGKAGDQTQKEVYTKNWSNSGWSAVLRAKNPDEAEKIAAAMEAACENDNIGYDQYERTTLYECAKKGGWNISGITEKCETDCSALVSVCVNAAEIELSKDVYTGNLQSALEKTGRFELLTDKSYTAQKEKLKRGDILVKKGHTVIVLENTNEKTASET